MTVTIYNVKGMTCGHCVSTVTSAVGAVPEVSDVEVDLAAGTVTVSGSASEQSVAQAISESGYEVDAAGGTTALPLNTSGGGCGCGCG
ncbi:MAG: cation transporter [Mycobacterium sp.]|jgi:copper chaperone|nr:heavy-metal-associated domain-containing protein [Mycobacterium sp.]MCB0938220.1 heavy-metal-associated domain-containing protein [Mycobacterium sp.]MCW1958260.1 cation transporter [Mycobacterium sp.]